RARPAGRRAHRSSAAAHMKKGVAASNSTKRKLLTGPRLFVWGHPRLRLGSRWAAPGRGGNIQLIEGFYPCPSPKTPNMSPQTQAREGAACASDTALAVDKLTYAGNLASLASVQGHPRYHIRPLRRFFEF